MLVIRAIQMGGMPDCVNKALIMGYTTKPLEKGGQAAHLRIYSSVMMICTSVSSNSA